MGRQGIIIGADGGGTGTRAVAITIDGLLIGRGFAGPSNPNNIGFVAAGQSIREAIRAALADSLMDDAHAICLGIAGIAAEEERQALAHELREQIASLEDKRLLITHDLEVAHEAAFDGSRGLCLVSGTGSACYAKDATGRSHRQSGRAPGLDDPGSGFAIGMKSIEAGLFAAPADPTRAAVARLAKQVIALADNGDEVARALLDDEAKALAELARPLIAALQGGRMPMALFGSNIERPSYYQKHVVHALLKLSPDIEVLATRPDAVIGALKLAWKTAGLPSPFPGVHGL